MMMKWIRTSTLSITRGHLDSAGLDEESGVEFVVERPTQTDYSQVDISGPRYKSVNFGHLDLNPS